MTPSDKSLSGNATNNMKVLRNISGKLWECKYVLGLTNDHQDYNVLGMSKLFLDRLEMSWEMCCIFGKVILFCKCQSSIINIISQESD